MGSGSFEISRAGSGQVRRFSNLTGLVGSGQQLFLISRVGSVRVGSGAFQNLAGRVGSGRVKSACLKKFAGRVGSADPTRLDLIRPDPTRPVGFDLTREKPWK